MQARTVLALCANQRTVGAVLFAVARRAKVTAPDRIELFDERSDNGRRIGQDAVFKIAALHTLSAHARARKVGAAEIGGLAVDDDTLEVNPRTDHPFKAINQERIFIKVLSEGRPGLLGMDQPHLHAAYDEVRDHLQERDHAAPLAGVLRVHVLDVRRGNPQLPLRMGRQIPYHPLINLPV